MNQKDEFSHLSNEDLARIAGVQLKSSEQMPKTDEYAHLSNEELMKIAGIAPPQESILHSIGRSAKNVLGEVGQEALNLGNVALNIPYAVGEAERRLGIPGFQHNMYRYQEPYQLPYEQESPEALAVRYGPLALTGPRALLAAGKEAAPLIGSALGKVGDILGEIFPKTTESLSTVKDMISGKTIKNTQAALDEHVKSIAEDLYGQPIEDVANKKLIGKPYKLLGKELTDNYKQQVAKSSQGYNDVMGDSLHEELPNEDFKNVRQLIAEIKPYSNSVLDSKINSFFNKQNYQTLHELKSAVGSRAAELDAPIFSAQKDVAGVNKTKSAYDTLENLLFDKFGQGYRDQTLNWKENVLPYKQNATIRKVVVQNQPSANLPKTLTKNISDIDPEQSNAIDRILSHMNDDQKDLILADRVKKAIDSKGRINNEKFMDKLSGSSAEGFEDFVKPHQQQMDEYETLSDLLAKQQAARNSLKTKALKGVAIGAAALGVPYTVKKLIGMF